jgi:hypothetical protein
MGVGHRPILLPVSPFPLVTSLPKHQRISPPRPLAEVPGSVLCDMQCRATDDARLGHAETWRMPVLSDINAPATLSHPFKAEAGREISACDSCAAAAALLRAIPAMLESRWW